MYKNTVVLASAPQRETENRRKAPGSGGRGRGENHSNTHNTIESVSEQTEQELPGPITLSLLKIQNASEDRLIKIRALIFKIFFFFLTIKSSWGR